MRSEIFCHRITFVIIVRLRRPVDALTLLIKECNRSVHRPNVLRHRCSCQFLDVMVFDAQFIHDLFHQFFRHYIRSEISLRNHTGHHNRLCKQSICFRNLAQYGYLSTAAGLSQDGHILRVTTKLRDVVTHPTKCLNQIRHPDIIRIRILRSEIRHIQISKRIQSMIDRNKDHIIELCQIKSIIAFLLNRRTCCISATMDPEHDRLLRCLIQ